jgi:DNA-binding transcriptional MerR regulator
MDVVTAPVMTMGRRETVSVSPVVFVVRTGERSVTRGILFGRTGIRLPRGAIRFTTHVFRFTAGVIRFTPDAIRLTSGETVVGRAVKGSGRAPIRFCPSAATFAAVERPMLYTMRELEALTGLTARTIRDYIRHGYLKPPTGWGPGATYDEEQMLRVVTIARMRAQKEEWETIAGRLEDWSIAKLRAFVRKTDPKPPLEAAAASVEALPPAQARPHPEAGTTTELDVLGGEDGALAGGTRLVVSQLLPGLVLMMNENAPPLVRRIAEEIVEKYRVRQ